MTLMTSLMTSLDCVVPQGAPLATFAPGRCRFCLYQQLKTARTAGISASPAEEREDAHDDAQRFCPLDLYAVAHDGARGQRALRALLRRPRNNLKVFEGSSGELVFGGAAGGERGALRALRALLRRTWRAPCRARAEPLGCACERCDERCDGRCDGRCGEDEATADGAALNEEVDGAARDEAAADAVDAAALAANVASGAVAGADEDLDLIVEILCAPSFIKSVDGAPLPSMQVLTTAPWHARTHASAHNGATPLVLRCAILRQECSLFERLQSAQARAAVGSARAARLHARALRLAGGAAALDELLAARHGAVSSTCMRVDALLAAPAAVVAEDVAAVEAEDVAAVVAEDVAAVAGVAGVAAVVHVEGVPSAADGRKASVHASAQHGSGSPEDTQVSAQHDAEGSLDECVTLVSGWLLGLVASDVSLMLAIERVREVRGTDAAAGSGAHAQPVDDLLAPGVVVLADRRRFCYRLAVVDMRPKPTRKVEEHAELDATMVAHWTARGGPPARRCSI